MEDLFISLFKWTQLCHFFLRWIKTVNAPIRFTFICIFLNDGRNAWILSGSVKQTVINSQRTFPRIARIEWKNHRSPSPIRGDYNQESVGRFPSCYLPLCTPTCNDQFLYDGQSKLKLPIRRKIILPLRLVPLSPALLRYHMHVQESRISSLVYLIAPIRGSCG